MARTTKPTKKAEPSSKRRDMVLLPTGSSCLNLACSERADGAFTLGRMVNIIGDSHSGKTFLCLSCLAEAVRMPEFDDYDIILDDVERANDFDIEMLFGKKLADRLEPPAWDTFVDPETKEEYELERNSQYIEEFHMFLRDRMSTGKPFIYVLDSFDALDALADEKKIDKMLKAYKKGEKAKGTYGLAKPRKASDLLRNITSNLKNTDSILIIISQTRDNINATMFEPKSVRSGGKALKFYAHHEMWLSVGGSIKDPSKKRIIGNKVRIKVSKSKLTGKVRLCEFTMLYNYGIDDIESCIDFLLSEGWWKKKKQTIQATELKVEMTRAKLIDHIEEKNLEKKLSKVVEKCWLDIEDSLKIDRKKRY